MKKIGEEMERRRSLCGFESMLQRLPDKLVFPGTPQEPSARKRIMLCTNLSEVILHTFCQLFWNPVSGLQHLGNICQHSTLCISIL